MFRDPTEKMAVSFTVITNIAVITHAPINKKGVDLIYLFYFHLFNVDINYI